MPQPSPLAIASSSLQRLVKEEASYHAEAEMQQKSIDRHKKSQSQMTSQGEGAEEEEDEDEDERGNRAFLLKQEKKALEETQALFPRLREGIVQGIADLEALLASASDEDPDVVRAREVVEHAKAAAG